ncbi:MAG: acyl-CoA carboxylase subunit epsilon [Micromonosporaceae bacterium]
MSEAAADTPRRPLLRVVRGAPTDEELAALTVVLAAKASAGAGPAPAEPRSEWRHRAALVRKPLHHGPGAWRAAARPH